MRLSAAKSYAENVADFRWNVPARFNIAAAVCDRHARGDGALALLYEDASGRIARYSFDDLAAAVNRLANVFAAHGIERGERVGILLPQRPETAFAHLAAYKLGAIAVPLFTQFGPDALEHRIADSGMRLLLTDEENRPKVEAVRAAAPALATLLCVDASPFDEGPFATLLTRASDRRETAETASDDPALLIYTSGTTGKPKGALHAHRVLLGHLPGVEWPHRFFPQPGDLFWTPADWAWAGGLLDVLLPSLYHRVPVLAYRYPKFDAEHAFALMERHRVRNCFIPPTALKMMRNAAPEKRHALRSLGSGGEALGEEILSWCREAFGAPVNEFYGQTEANLLVANCDDVFPIRRGSMGRPVPGHTVVVLGEDGAPVPDGESGIIALRRPDPVLFLGYYNRPEATAEKFRGDWFLTGDVATRDADGYLWFAGREDDLISSAGYRIGPTDIEECLTAHDAVLLAAAIGVPDPVRGDIVKAYVVLGAGHEPTPALRAALQAHVRERLAAYQYPREIVFVEDLPMTSTGKIMRRTLRDRERAR